MTMIIQEDPLMRDYCLSLMRYDPDLARDFERDPFNPEYESRLPGYEVQDPELARDFERDPFNPE